MVEVLAARAPDIFMLVTSTADAERAHREGKVGLAMGMENGAPLAGDLAELERYAARGIRYITLAHSKSNHISDSSYDMERQWNGLSEFGKRLVPEMNRFGVMIDVSHISDEAFWEVIELSRTPVIASHSSARHFTPGFERNMGDDMIRALAAQGGVVQINFGSTFLTERANSWWNEYKAKRDAWLTERGLEDDADAAAGFYAGYTVHDPFPYATLGDVLDHIDHIVEIAGIDHVGIGSDFDGVGDSLPVGLKSPADFPALAAGLQARGHSDDDVAKILGGNLLRVWRANEEFATR
jgi:membrane dipeptidase